MPTLPNASLRTARAAVERGRKDDGVHSDEELDRLLARGKLGGPTRERVLERVLDRVAPRPSARRWAWASGIALASAAAVLLLVRPGAHDGFTAKGGAVDNGARVEATCLDGSASRCPSGGTLVFRVERADAGGFLVAYAIREGAPDDARIWYFPSDDGVLPELRRQSAPQVITRGVRLGPEHAPARYVVHTAIAARRLSRAEVLDPASRDVSRRGTFTFEVVP